MRNYNTISAFQMSAKYVTFSSGQSELERNDMPSTSRTMDTVHDKNGVIHIYQNHQANDGTDDEEYVRITGNKCGNETMGASQAVLSLGDVDEPGEDDQFNMGYAKFLLRNVHQFLSISGGLVLLFPAGLHMVWALTKFTWLDEKENTFTVFVIFTSWYLGAIAGSLLGGVIVPIWSKKTIYISSAVLLFISTNFLLSDADFCLISGRLLAGVTHGVLYITVIVHASENSVKEFREILILIIGGAINCSHLLAALVFQPLDRVFFSKTFVSIGSITYIAMGIALVLVFSIESIPHLVRQYCTESEALENLAKLQHKNKRHPTVYQDYLTIRKMCDDELMIYGSSAYSKLFAKCNFRPLIFCCYGRIISVLSINLPMVTMILIFIREKIEEMMPERSNSEKQIYINETNMTSNDSLYVNEANPLAPRMNVFVRDVEVIETSFLFGLFNHEIQLVIIVWCAFGISTVAALYLFDRKRFIYYACCALGILLIFCGIAHKFFQFLSTITHLCLIGYFNYTTFAMDLFGHGFLAEAFPSTLKPISIAYVAAVEHFIHVLIIFLYMCTWFHDRIIVTMVFVTLLAFEIAEKMPRTNDLSLMDAAREYKKINVRFVDGMVESYALRMI